MEQFFEVLFCFLFFRRKLFLEKKNSHSFETGFEKSFYLNFQERFNFMMKSIMLLFIFASCGEVPVFRKIKVLHFTGDLTMKKDKGEIKVEQCKHLVGEEASFGSINFYEILESVRSKKGGLTYIQDLRTDYKKTSLPDLSGKNIYSKECFMMKGRGFQ